MSNNNGSKKKAKDYSTPSLLEPESRGGDTAEGGFSFQDGVVLATIPEWLAHEGFGAFIRESIGDVESRWFEPATGEIVDAIEAKNHRITPAPFWNEIERFQTMASSPQYRCFTLACTTVSEEIKAISEAMRRIRDPAAFYGDDSTVVMNSVDDFAKLVEEKGRTRTDAEFLLSRVDVSVGWTSSRSSAEGMFRQGAEKWIPGFSELSGRQVGCVFNRLLALVHARLNQPITRKEMESAICAALEDDGFFANHRIRVETTTSGFAGTETAMRFEWDRFFGGNERIYPAPRDWQSEVVEQLEAARTWITENRSQRRIVLSGERRLSTLVALGSQFPAVAGFNIDLEYRGTVWATDSHSQAEDVYNIVEMHVGETGSELVVIVDILRNVSEAVNAACTELGLKGLPVIRFHGSEVINSDRQANTVVRFIKQSIKRRLHGIGAETIHLFLACPAPLALFLGHRLNATAEIQCYEWTGASSYVPTCYLRT